MSRWNELAVAVALSGVALVVRSPVTLGQETLLAAVPAPSARQLCLDGIDDPVMDPLRMVTACDVTITRNTDGPDVVGTAHLARGIAKTRLGETRLAEADYRAAIGMLTSVIDAARPNPLVVFHRGVAFHALGDVDRALADYGSAIQGNPRNAAAFLNRGIILAKYKGQLTSAIADFDDALALAPDDLSGLLLRGDAHAMLGQYGSALVDLNHAAEVAPANPRVYVLRGLAYSRRNDVANALADYDRAIGIDGNDVDALVNRAALYAGAGDNDRAIDDLDRALRLQPANALALYNRGYSRFARRDYEKAIADYSAALGANPEFGMAYNNRCLTRVVAKRDIDQARLDCRQAVERLAGNVDVRETLGIVHLLLNEPDRALAEYDKALEIGGKRGTALYGRALAKLRLFDMRGADADRQAALTLEPAVDQAFMSYGLH